MESSPLGDSTVPPPGHPPLSSGDVVPDDYRPNLSEPYTMPQQIAGQAFDTYPNFSGSHAQPSRPAGVAPLRPSSPSPQPPLSPYNPSAALALAKSLAKVRKWIADEQTNANGKLSPMYFVLVASLATNSPPSLPPNPDLLRPARCSERIKPPCFPHSP